MTYSQPFATGHGFTPSQSGTCDNSYTDNANDSTNGNPVNSVNTLCNGRNDHPTTTWSKSLTWEDMGVTPGSTVVSVDGKFDHQRTTQTHNQTPGAGPLTTSCTATNLEDHVAYPNSTGLIPWATQDQVGAVNVTAGACQSSSTSVTVSFQIDPWAGNNSSAESQVNFDNLVLVITEQAAEGGKRVINYVVKLRFDPSAHGLSALSESRRAADAGR